MALNIYTRSKALFCLLLFQRAEFTSSVDDLKKGNVLCIYMEYNKSVVIKVSYNQLIY